MQQNVEVRITADDSQIQNALQNLTNSAGRLQDSIDAVGNEAAQSFDQMTDAVRDADKATAGAIRTAKEYQAQIDRNNATIEATENAMRDQRIELLKLQQALANTKKGTAEFDKLRGAVDQVSASLDQQRRSVEILNLENQRMTQQVNAAGGSMRLASHQVTNLRFQLTDLFTQIASGQGVFRPLLQQGPQIMEALGGPREALQFLRQAFVNAGRAIFSFTGLMTILTVAIGALIGAPLLAYLAKTEGAFDGIQQRLAGLTARFNLFINRIADLGGAIVGLFSGTKQWGDVTAAAGNVAAGGYDEAAKAARELKQAQIELEREMSKRIVQNAIDNALIEANKRLIGDTNVSTREKIRLINQNLSLQKTQIENELRLAQMETKRIEQGLTADQINARSSKEHQAALAKEIEIQARSNGLTYDATASIRDLRKEQAAQAKERRDQLEELTKMTNDFLRSIQKLQDDQLTGYLKIQAAEREALRLIDEEEKALRKAYEERRVTFDLEDELAQKRLITQQLFAEQTAKLARDIQMAEYARMNAVDEEERASVQRRLTAVTELAQKNADLQDSELKRLAVISQGYQMQLSLAQEFFLAGQLSAADVAQIRRNADAAIQAYKDAVSENRLTFLESFKAKLLNALALSPQEAQAIQGALNNALSASFSLIEQLNNERITRIDAEIERIDGRIEQAQSAVEEERRRAQEGYANNLRLAEENLLKEQELRRKALEERAALEAKAARQQLAIDSAQQASSVVSAIANVLALETKTKGAVGAIIALSSIALIAGIMAKARAIAQQQREAVQGFATGTEYVQGAGTTTSDSIPARLSVGERVVPADLNAKLGGKALPNSRLVELVELGRQMQRLPIVDTNNIAGVVQALSSAMQQASEAQRREQLAAIKEATLQAAGRNAAEIIEYMKSRPVEYPTQEGKVVEWKQGAVLRRTVIKKD